MTTTLIVTIIAAIIATGLMVLGLAITLLRKGHHIQSDVGDNDEMKKHGIMCASAEFRREEAILRGEDPTNLAGCGKGVCGDCAVDELCDEKKSL